MKIFARILSTLTIWRFYLLLFSIAALLTSANVLYAQKNKTKKGGEYIQIRVYHATRSEQLAALDQYLQSSLLPALAEAGFQKPGMFTAIDNDTATDKRMYVFIAIPNITLLEKLTEVFNKTILDTVKAADYTKAAYNRAPFQRFETILLRAFDGAPRVLSSGLTGNISEKVYELRSYESATEALHQNKVQMFNAGEIDLFKRLGFNAVFYGQVVAGSRMPNLMYMTSFESKTSRDEHWKTFGNDPEWKAMSAKPEYQHNVSKIETVFLRPLPYSKL